MNGPLLEQLVTAVLYEGHLLYPYRPSATKNQQRFTFGRIYPRAYCLAQNGLEPCLMQTECLLLRTSTESHFKVTVRFLQPSWREIGLLVEPVGNGESEPPFLSVPELRIEGHHYQSWHEAVERTLELEPISAFSEQPFFQRFEFPAERLFGFIPTESGPPGGVLIRHKAALCGTVEIGIQRLEDDLVKLSVRVCNETRLTDHQLDDQDSILMRTFASTHTILQAFGGDFISLLDPPSRFSAAPARCQNIGTWPVLVGNPDGPERDAVLSSPIILSDYPQIAPESAGDLFDGTEIDEILTLRVLTMTPEEKAEMRDSDVLARRLLERTESLLPEQLSALHGRLHQVRTAEEFLNAAWEKTAIVQGVKLKAGDRVRIRPKNRADIMDLALAGKIAIIEAIEQDLENQIHFALVVEDDPGRDLGMTRYPGHRFFFALEEVEPLEPGP